MPKQKQEPGGISPEQAAKVLAADLANMVKKVASGQTLSPRERELLQNVSHRGKAAKEGDGLVKNHTHLAEALGVSRRTIIRYSKREDAPRPRPNSSHSVSEWRKFLAKHNVVDDEEDLSSTELKAKQILLQNQKLEHQLAVLRGEYMATVDVEQMVASMVEQAKRVLLSGPASLAPQVVGMTIPEAEALLRQWLHDAMAQLHIDPVGQAEKEAI